MREEGPEALRRRQQAEEAEREAAKAAKREAKRAAREAAARNADPSQAEFQQAADAGIELAKYLEAERERLRRQAGLTQEDVAPVDPVVGTCCLRPGGLVPESCKVGKGTVHLRHLSTWGK